MTIFYGTIGYVLLSSPNEDRYVLILSDSHSQLPYCGNYIEISDWFKQNINKLNVKLLLEEVPRTKDINLIDIFPNAEHTANLKKLYLDNPSLIHAIDIRNYLIPYSWETKMLVSSNETLKEYLLLIEDFFNFKNVDINKYLDYNLNEQINSVKELKNNFDLIINKYNELKKINEKYMNQPIKNIENNILENINDINDMIMEFLVISKIYKLNNKNIIIHTGLMHANAIVNLLLKYYSYELRYKSNINYNGDCITIPNHVLKKI